jgi:pyruvate kinase
MIAYEKRFRRTKIVATIGPASSDEAVLAAMIDAGVNVVRVNSSHGTPTERVELIERVRSVRERNGRHVGILVDLQGPRIRVGTLDHPLELVKGADVVFAPERDVRPGEIPTTYDALAEDVHEGAKILLDDGLLSVEVTRVDGSRVRARVGYGGTLKSHKGMNLPGVQVSAPPLTDKDREDITLALEHGADFIGVSFVRRAEDVAAVRELVPEQVQLVAKIEKAAALDDLPRIVDAAEVLMVARGDLGVELPFEEVPLRQKQLISEANRHGRAVITATQMLESMVRNPRPTRAEASDVANAILDGTDALMLSAETAVGVYPVQAVQAMVRIIHEIERTVLEDRGPRRRRSDLERSGVSVGIEDAVALATGVAAELLHLPLIVCFTKSGFTARKIAAYRPRTPIVGLSTEPATCRQLELIWGVIPELATVAPTYEAMLGIARESLVAKGYVQPGERIAVTAGVPFEVPGTTNLLKIETV